MPSTTSVSTCTGCGPLDAGASTGGFTQVLLERGCPEVIAVDVGRGQLDPRLRADPRVRVWERTNLRALTLDHVDQRLVDLVVADVSFISLTLLIAPLVGVLRPDGDLLVMIKPQFEVGRERVGRGGVVRDPSCCAGGERGAGGRRRARLVDRLIEPVAGAAGNLEYFALRRRTVPAEPSTGGRALSAGAAGKRSRRAGTRARTMVIMSSDLRNRSGLGCRSPSGRDRTAAAAIRTVLAALDNAEAVPVPAKQPPPARPARTWPAGWPGSVPRKHDAES